jgi:hypothetical protein
VFLLEDSKRKFISVEPALGSSSFRRRGRLRSTSLDVEKAFSKSMCFGEWVCQDVLFRVGGFAEFS